MLIASLHVAVTTRSISNKHIWYITGTISIVDYRRSRHSTSTVSNSAQKDIIKNSVYREWANTARFTV